MTAETKLPRSAGRPRDPAVGSLILSTARDLVVRHGYEGVTTEMIAKAAGASKQTIYRRWPGKADLVLEAFLAYATRAVDSGMAATARPVSERLALFLRRTFAALEKTGPAIRSLMASAQSDAEFRRTFKTRFIEPRRRSLAALLQLGIERGELASDCDIEAAVIALYGAVWYRLLLDEPMDHTFAQRLGNTILTGLGARARKGGATGWSKSDELLTATIVPEFSARTARKFRR
jgi:AcrR family transcriptional regulator